MGITDTAPLFQVADAELDRRLRAGMAEVEQRLIDTLTHAGDSFLTEGATHLVIAGGKRLRPMLVLLGSHFGDPTEPKIVDAAVTAELVHVATLYHDDVMDEAPTRHGVPSANVRWNNNIAVLLGDLLLANAAELGASLGDEAVKLQAETLNRLVKGQLRETVGLPLDGDPMAHCIEVMADKSAALFNMAGRIGGLVAGAPAPVCDALGEFGELLGIAFQISDDLIDIRTEHTESGKTPGTDLREGVVTVPVLHALAVGDDIALRLRGLMADNKVADEHVAEALELLRSSSGLAAAEADVRSYIAKARERLVDLPEGPARDTLYSLCDFVVARTA